MIDVWNEIKSSVQYSQMKIATSNRKYLHMTSQGLHWAS